MQASGVLTAVLNERYRGYLEKEARLAGVFPRRKSCSFPKRLTTQW